MTRSGDSGPGPGCQTAVYGRITNPHRTGRAGNLSLDITFPAAS